MHSKRERETMFDALERQTKAQPRILKERKLPKKIWLSSFAFLPSANPALLF